MRAIFPKDELPKAFALFGPVIGGAAVLGPIIGGLLVSVHGLGGWRLIFFVNVPLGHRHGDRRSGADARGARPVATAGRPARRGRSSARRCSLWSIRLIEGREAGWPAWTFASLAGGVVLLVVFAVQQVLRTRAGKDALIEPSAVPQPRLHLGDAGAARLLSRHDRRPVRADALPADRPGLLGAARGAHLRAVVARARGRRRAERRRAREPVRTARARRRAAESRSWASCC